MSAAFVTVALNISISTNGVYANGNVSPEVTQCSTTSTMVAVPVHAFSPEATIHGHLATVAGSSRTAPLRLPLGDLVARGYPNSPTSQPTTPLAVPTADIMDLQQKLASLSTSGGQQVSPDATLSSPSSSKESDAPEEVAEQQRQRKVLPSTIDFYGLEQELSKLHSQGGPQLKVKDTGALATASVGTQSDLCAQVGQESVKTAAADATVSANQCDDGAKIPSQPSVRKISRFSVSIVKDESESKDNQSLNETKDPELLLLLQKQDLERKALARKHEEEIASFHARQKQQQKETPPASSSVTRTPSPSTSPETTLGSIGKCDAESCDVGGIPIPSRSAVGSAPPSSVPSSSPGTPTRTTKTFTDDLLRLVQDLGSKTPPKKSEATEKPPTLNQLRSGSISSMSTSPGSNSNPLNQHSLTKIAGINDDDCDE